MPTLRAPTAVRLLRQDEDRLKALADRNERSLSAEIRLAIREHLNVHDPPDKETGPPVWRPGGLSGLADNRTTCHHSYIASLDDDALPISEDPGCPPDPADGQGNAAEDGE